MKFLIWLVYFIASFAALHYGMVAFGYDLLALPMVTQVPNLVKIVQMVFGLCGLISIITMFMPKCCE